MNNFVNKRIDNIEIRQTKSIFNNDTVYRLEIVKWRENEKYKSKDYVWDEGRGMYRAKNDSHVFVSKSIIDNLKELCHVIALIIIDEDYSFDVREFYDRVAELSLAEKKHYRSLKKYAYLLYKQENKDVEEEPIVNPIIDNRIIYDTTFAIRLLNYLEYHKVEVDEDMEYENLFLRTVANQLLKYQKLTCTDKEEKEFINKELGKLKNTK